MVLIDCPDNIHLIWVCTDSRPEYPDVSRWSVENKQHETIRTVYIHFLGLHACASSLIQHRMHAGTCDVNAFNYLAACMHVWSDEYYFDAHSRAH